MSVRCSFSIGPCLIVTILFFWWITPENTNDFGFHPIHIGSKFAHLCLCFLVFLSRLPFDLNFCRSKKVECEWARQNVRAKTALPCTKLACTKMGRFFPDPVARVCILQPVKSCHLISIIKSNSSNFYCTVFCLHVMAISKNFPFGFNRLVYTPFDYFVSSQVCISFLPIDSEKLIFHTKTIKVKMVICIIT